jgi:hypothetical protein
MVHFTSEEQHLMRKLAYLLMVVVIASAALAQKEVPSPPKPTDDGPSLEVTLKFIQEKMNDQGAVGYGLTRSNLPGVTFRTFYRMSGVVADATTCSLHKIETTNTRIEVATENGYLESGKPVMGDDLIRQSLDTSTISLRDVESLRVESRQDGANRQSAERGYPDVTFTVAPQVFDLVLMASRPAFSFHNVITIGKQPPKTVDPPLAKEDHLFFREEETAKRLAKAITHALELCGGGNQDPF